jgi:hypothetical protein
MNETKPLSWYIPTMKRLLIVAAIVCLSAFSLLGQSAPKLTITVKSDKNSYSLRDKIHLTFVRQNDGKQNLLIPRQWGWGVMRTDIHVFDAKGYDVRTAFLPDELPPPPQPYDFVLLEPGEFVGTHIDEDATQFVNSPGDYELVVDYTSYLPETYAREVMKMPSAPFWSRERGTVTSSRIKLHITQ